MKGIIFVLLISLVGCEKRLVKNDDTVKVLRETASAKSKSRDCELKTIHPKMKAECLAFKVIINKTSDEVNNVILKLEENGYKVSLDENIEKNEITSIYIKGYCRKEESFGCDWFYAVPFEATNREDKLGSITETVLLIIKSSSNGIYESELVRAYSSKDLI